MVNDGFSTDNRQCPVCGGKVLGRRDKQYCCEDCRSAHNLSLRKAAEAPLMRVLSALRKNRSILKKLCANKKSIVSRERLEALEFDASTFSSIHTNARNQTYYFCGDYGFLPMKRDGVEIALVIRRESYATSANPWENPET